MAFPETFFRWSWWTTLGCEHSQVGQIGWFVVLYQPGMVPGKNTILASIEYWPTSKNIRLNVSWCTVKRRSNWGTMFPHPWWNGMNGLILSEYMGNSTLGNLWLSLRARSLQMENKPLLRRGFAFPSAHSQDWSYWRHWSYWRFLAPPFHPRQKSISHIYV